ncbi:MAG: DUF58 domain-containing protein [Haloarculaceae archaeon]
MSDRRLASLLGVAALGLGLAVMVAPGIVGFGPGPILVWGVGGLVLLRALGVIQNRRRSDLDEAVTPDPELPTATPPPGEDIEAVLEGFLDTRNATFHRGRVREGLRSAAVAVLSRYGTYSEAEAEAALDAGTWTDDRSATAFLGEANAPPLSPLARVRNRFRDETSMDRAVRHTVDAIAAAAGLEPRSGGSDGAARRLGIGRGREARAADAGREPSSTDVTTRGDDGSDRGTADVVSRATHPTGHWRGVSVVALVGIGAGVLVGEPAVLLAGAVGIGFAAYARSSVLPPGSVSIDRSLGVDRPEPGEDVRVTVTVTNRTDRFIPDLRLVDGVPGPLAVVDGSPRLGTALRPGERTSFTYTVQARRGIHTFDRALLVARDLPGSAEQERSIAAATETTLTCVPSLRPSTEPVPLRERATRYVGQVETAEGGDGVELYATREYRRGDALSRIDWNRRARTGELTTVEFQEERAATVVLVIDATAAAYVSGHLHDPHAVDRAVDAAGRIYASLSGAGHRVGVAAPGPEGCWLAPGSDVDHAVEARELLATHPALSSVPGGIRSTTRWQRRLRERLPAGTQIVFLTPLGEAYGARFARQFEAYGYPVTVVSPDPTADRTAGNRLARIARTLRVTALRATGIPVIDWPPDRTIDEAIARYNERWER